MRAFGVALSFFLSFSLLSCAVVREWSEHGLPQELVAH
jgi:hypothetical protein